MESARPGGRRISVGDVVGETFSTYGQNAAPLIWAALVVFVVIGLISGLLQVGGGVLLLILAAIVRFAGYALYTGFVVRLVEDARVGRRDRTVGDLFSAAAPAILNLIVFGILWGIGVTIGLALLIIPGLILITFWSVGAPAIVVEGAGPIDAFSRSWELVRHQAWSVFATLLVVLLIVIGIGIVLGIIATPISDAATVVAIIVADVLTAPIFALAVSVIFFDLGGGRAVAAAAAPTEPPPPSAPAA